jgi:hypothetical protein
VWFGLVVVGGRCGDLARIIIFTDVTNTCRHDSIELSHWTHFQAALFGDQAFFNL